MYSKFEFHAFIFEGIIFTLVEAIELAGATSARSILLIKRNEDTEAGDFLVEIATVELHAQNRFVKALQLRDGELLIEQIETDRLEVYTLAKHTLCASKDTIVVESKCRQLLDIPPLSLHSVVTCHHFVVALSDQSIVGYGHDSLARVSVDAAECVELLDKLDVDSGLFKQLSTGTLCDGLIHSHKSTRQCPTTFKRLNASLDEQNSERLAIETEDYAVGCQRSVRILVTIFIFVVHTLIVL